MKIKNIPCKQRKNVTNDKKENLVVGGKIWIEYWRKNIEIFVEQYFGLKLFLFQKILIHMMHKSNFFCFIACRGIGKSFLTAVYCCAVAILYPKIKIVIVSGQKGQADAVITEKIAQLMHDSPALSSEVIDRGIQTFHNKTMCRFKNGSQIISVASNQGARGFRANILLCDEYRMINKEILDSVLKPFLTEKRTPPFYTTSEKYKDYPKEKNKEIYLSSAWLKQHWSWEKFTSITQMMLEGKSATAVDISVDCSLAHGLIDKEKVEEDRKASGEFTYMMEYEGIFFGENENSFYRSGELNDCRVLKHAYYPLTDDEYKQQDMKKKRLKQMVRKDGEVRIIGVDFARMSSNKNDNSVFTLMRLLPSGDSYSREIVYMESFNGMRIENQATRLKRLFTEFEADKLIIDGNGNGVGLIDEMAKSSYDRTIDEHYPAFGVYDSNVNTDMEEVKDGLNVIYVIKAFEKTNNDVMIYLKNALLSKKIRLLIDEGIKENDFKNDKRFHEDSDYHVEMIMPFIQTSQFIFETLNLDCYVNDKGNHAIKNTSKRKDRFSSVAYANYLAELEEKANYRNKHKKKNNFLWFN